MSSLLLINSPQVDFRGHIDDGSMGGGGPITHETPIDHDRREELYIEHFLNNNPINPRKGIFRWCIIAHEITEGRTGSGIYRDSFVIADKVCPNKEGIFMHELGHSLGLSSSDFDGIDNDESQFSSGSDYKKYKNYKSCMNYRYTFTIIDYSDGSRETDGNPNDSIGADFDDWGNIDLCHFN